MNGAKYGLYGVGSRTGITNCSPPHEVPWVKPSENSSHSFDVTKSFPLTVEMLDTDIFFTVINGTEVPARSSMLPTSPFFASVPFSEAIQGVISAASSRIAQGQRYVGFHLPLRVPKGGNAALHTLNANINGFIHVLINDPHVNDTMAKSKVIYVSTPEKVRHVVKRVLTHRLHSAGFEINVVSDGFEDYVPKDFIDIIHIGILEKASFFVGNCASSMSSMIHERRNAGGARSALLFRESMLSTCSAQQKAPHAAKQVFQNSDDSIEAISAHSAVNRKMKFLRYVPSPLESKWNLLAQSLNLKEGCSLWSADGYMRKELIRDLRSGYYSRNMSHLEYVTLDGYQRMSILHRT